MVVFAKKQKNQSGRRRNNLDEKPNNVTFQRNRTLVSSHSKEPPAEESQREKAHRSKRRRRKIVTILLLVLAFAAAGVWLASQFTATVNINVKNVSISLESDERYSQVVQDYLYAHPLERLRFVLNQTSLNQYVSSELPEVAQITQLGGFDIGQTDFAVNMRSPVASWQINGKRYYVDGNGAAFDINYFDEPPVTIVDDSGIYIESGQTVASSRFLAFVGRVVSLSEQQGYTVTEAVIPYGTTRKLEVKLRDYQTSVYMTIDRGVGEQVEDMARSLKYLSARGLSPSYIDVRVESKTFYK